MKTKKLLKAAGLGMLLGVALVVAVCVPGGALMTLPLFGAVTVTETRRSNDEAVATVIATLDADTTATYAHGLGAVPGGVTLTNLLQAAAGLSLWAATTIDATNVICTKSVAVGSGNAGAQLRIEVRRAR